MPSSTSSSERAIPGSGWDRTWIVALIIAIGGVAAIEHAVRANGTRPSVADEPTLWAINRAQVDGDRNIVAFLGSSRMALGYDRDTFEAAAPGFRGVQLAIHRSSGVGALEDLADDDDFIGLAIVDVSEWDLEPMNWSIQQTWLEQPHQLWRMPGAIINRHLAAFAQSHLAVLDLGGQQVLASLVGHRNLPKPNWVTTETDRTQHGDYSYATEDELAKRRDRNLEKLQHDPPSPATWLAALAPVEDAVRRIQARGGRVAFVRMPISGTYAKIGDEHFPRALYWDAFARHTAAMTIHYRDVPALASLTCPDDTHLDRHDQVLFTRELVAKLRAQGFFSYVRS